MRHAHLVPLLVLVAVAAAAAAASGASASSSCSQGDSSCHCEALGGKWKSNPAPLLSACRVSWKHAGRERYAHVFLPNGYDGSTPYPIYIQLHGVFWTTMMGDMAKTVGPVNATDVVPYWDGAVKTLGDKAILVYPQATGEPGTGDASEGQGERFRQFWSVPFWTTSAGVRSEAGVDDVGFIEAVVEDLPRRLPLAPGRYYLGGQSAGGMLVEALLCESEAVAGSVTAFADLLGGVGEQYASGPKCASSPAAPYLKVQGMADKSITYDTRILVDGVTFLSAVEAAQQRAEHNGCAPDDAAPEAPEAGGAMVCRDLCAKAAGKPTAKVCGMPGVGHTTDFPHPGFVFEQAWEFFEEQAKAAAAADKKAGKPKRAAAAANGTDEPEELPADAAEAQRLTLNLTFPGADLEAFRSGEQGRGALEAVANVSGVPTDNITATYAAATAAAPSGGARRLRAAAAPAGGVVATYSLAAEQPPAAAKALVGAVKDGSLAQALRERGVGGAAAAAAPTASLEADGGPEPKVLLKPTKVAPAGGDERDGDSAAPKRDGGDAEADGAPAEATPRAAAADGGPQPAAAAAPAQPPAGQGGNKGAAIAGAVVGGAAGAALLGAAAWWFTRRQRSGRRAAAPHLQATDDAVMCVSDGSESGGSETKAAKGTAAAV